MHLLSFIIALKQDDTQEIITHLIADFDKVLPLSKKINILIENICSLSPKTLEIVLPMFNIVYNYGKPESLYVKAVECSPRTFGFINAYYNPSKKFRTFAYIKGVYLNKLENIKKIKGVSLSRLKGLRDNIQNIPGVNQAVKNYVILDYTTASSKKDKSPADDLIKKQKGRVSRLKAQFA